MRAMPDHINDEIPLDRLCVCGHTAAEHADPASGDTRCLVVGECAQLAHIFDDGRGTANACCACLRFTAI